MASDESSKGLFADIIIDAKELEKNLIEILK